MATRTGGCACGAVRFELQSEPFECGWCHCTTCQRLSGAPGMVWSSVARSDFAYIAGSDQVQPSKLTSFAERTYCGRCGSQLTIAYDFQPDTLDFAVGTLDDPGAVPPAHHIFWASKPAWFEIEDGLPRFARFRPGTQGLDGTEPPGE